MSVLCPGCSRLYWAHGESHGYVGHYWWWKLYGLRMCYSYKTIVFTYIAFSLGFQPGTWENVLTQEANLEPQPNWSTQVGQSKALCSPDREKQNKPNWGFMNTLTIHVFLGFYDASGVGKSNVLRHHSTPVTVN